MTSSPSPAPQKRVAVVGSGVSGLTAAYALAQSGMDVTVFERADRLGGHADTHEVLGRDGLIWGVDTGFIVHNQKTYPVLLTMFEELGVETQPSEMSMSVSCAECGLEYAGAKGLTGLLASTSAARPAYLKMLWEVTRFHRAARAVLALPAGEGDEPLEEFLARQRFSTYFVSHFMTPVVSAVWSCPPSEAGKYPARYLFSFLANHGMLAVTGSPQWRTVTGGSMQYVERLRPRIGAVRTSCAVERVERLAQGVRLTLATGETAEFDGAVIATHSQQALALLAAPTAAEQATLGAITYTGNPTVLHTDESLLPRSSRARASWNYAMASCSADASEVLVSYDLTRLQRLDTSERFIVTLNAPARIKDSSVLARMDYEHPQYTRASVEAQGKLEGLSDDTVAFAGAYHGWGFHEDGARSGRDAARRLGASW